MGQVHKIRGAEATPTFAHAGETFLAAHTHRIQAALEQRTARLSR